MAFPEKNPSKPGAEGSQPEPEAGAPEPAETEATGTKSTGPEPLETEPPVEYVEFKFPESRDSLRVPIDFPVRIYGQRAELVTQLRNISRTGMGLYLPVTTLIEIEPDLPMDDVLAVASAVDSIIGTTFDADLHCEMLGPLVRKHATILRAGFSDDDAEILQLGCRFEETLSTEEADMLGVGLPDQGITEAEAMRNVPAPRHRADNEAPDGSSR